MPKVSLVMAAYNGERYIGAAIDSVLAQRSVDLELIVVNDGSTDRTPEILAGYAKADPRVRVINRQNSGRPAIPKNDGVVAARGDYVCFLDQDDLIDPERTRQLVDGLDRHPEWVAAFHDMRIVGGDGTPRPGSYLGAAGFLEKARAYLMPMEAGWFECSESFFVFQSLVTGALHTHSVLIARNRLPPDTIRFDTQFAICDDTDLWVRLGLLGKMGYLDKVLCSYRKHDSNLTLDSEKFLVDAVRYHKHNLQRIEGRLSPEQAAQLRARISGCLADLGYVRYLQYRPDDARAAYREAMDWSFSRKALVGYLKTLIPAPVLRGLKTAANR